MEFTSQIKQDIYVVKFLDGKKGGTFVEIGCRTPVRISNTCALEKELGWRGIGIDIKEYVEKDGTTWAEHRPNTVLVLQDALTINYQDLFRAHAMPEVIDFLSIDIEPTDDTLKCLFMMPFDKYKFNVVAFETAAYLLKDGRGGIAREQDSRAFMKQMGYRLVTTLGIKDNAYGQDDIYVRADVKYPVKQL